jgi:hypothetical protein
MARSTTLTASQGRIGDRRTHARRTRKLSAKIVRSPRLIGTSTRVRRVPLTRIGALEQTGGDDGIRTHDPLLQAVRIEFDSPPDLAQSVTQVA